MRVRVRVKGEGEGGARVSTKMETDQIVIMVDR